MTDAWKEARQNLAGGVDSPVRAFKAVGGEPVFMKLAFGPFLYDNHDRRYVDFCLSWGAVILGHADEGVISAIQKQAVKGTSFGTATEYETALAREIKKAFPMIERLRFTSSGTEAVMSAIRLARGVTGRDEIVKFEGCYHGHADSLLVKAGSGLATFGAPDSAGVPAVLAKLTTVLPYNDVAALKDYFRRSKPPACVIVEPVAGNMGVVPASKAFLETLRALCSKHGSLLVFDEVISGFRTGYGGAQHLYRVKPDITTLGKIIGGGLPVGAFGASRDIMENLSPEGKVYQAGTLSGNPLSMAAGLAVLSRLDKAFYDRLNARAADFVDRASAILRKKGPVSVNRVGSMFTFFFSAKRPADFSDVMRSDKRRFARFFRASLKAGVYLPPSAFESAFISGAHGDVELSEALEAFRGV